MPSTIRFKHIVANTYIWIVGELRLCVGSIVSMIPTAELTDQHAIFTGKAQTVTGEVLQWKYINT